MCFLRRKRRRNHNQVLKIKIINSSNLLKHLDLEQDRQKQANSIQLLCVIKNQLFGREGEYSKIKCVSSCILKEGNNPHFSCIFLTPLQMLVYVINLSLSILQLCYFLSLLSFFKLKVKIMEEIK